MTSVWSFLSKSFRDHYQYGLSAIRSRQLKQRRLPNGRSQKLGPHLFFKAESSGPDRYFAQLQTWKTIWGKIRNEYLELDPQDPNGHLDCIFRRTFRCRTANSNGEPN